MPQFICEFCNVSFKRYGQKRKASFCSQKCFNDYRKDLTKNQDFFIKLDTPEKAYWLGFLYADGNLTKPSRKQKSVNLELALKDKCHLMKFAEIFSSQVNEYRRGCCQSAKVSISSEMLWNSLIKLGFKPGKKFISNDEVWQHIPSNVKSHFIRGVFDGDGSIFRNKKTGYIGVSFTGNDQMLANIVEWLVQNAQASRAKPFKRKNAQVYAVAWSGKYQIDRIGNSIYQNASVYLDRKRQRFLAIEISKIGLDGTGVNNDRRCCKD